MSNATTAANRPLTVGMVQMRVEPGRPQANLRRAELRIAEAARAGCDGVVLPECLDLGWGDGRARQLAMPIPGPHAERLAAAAREHRIMVVAGLVERAGAALYNAAVLIDDSGRLCLLHRKLHELNEVTGGLYAVGDRLGVAHTRLGVIGVDICADNAPEPGGHGVDIGSALAGMGAQIILSPSAWAVLPNHDNIAEPYGRLWRDAYGRLAAAHGLPVVGVSSVGRLEDGAWAGWKVIGASLAMAGDGSVAAQGAYGEDADELVVAAIALRPPAMTERIEP